MTDLEQQLRRLSERGPIVDSRFAIRRAMQQASIELVETDRVQAGADGSARLSLADDFHNEPRHALRGVGLAAAVLLSLAGVGGVLSARSGVSSPGTNRPAFVSVPLEIPDSQMEPAPESSTLTPREDDPMLSAMMFALLQIPTAEEMVTFYSYNVPQSQVAACMHNAGFDYEEEASPDEQVAEDPQYILPPAEFASLYGFGIVSQQLGILQIGSDPNWNYTQSLSQSDQEAYARWKGSCGGATTERMRDSTALNAAFSEFSARLDADHGRIAAIAGWRSCMSGAGYEYTTPMAMLESFYLRMNDGIKHDALERLFAEELAVAIANVPCHAAYKLAYRDVASSRYGEFRDLVDAARAAAGS